MAESLRPEGNGAKKPLPKPNVVVAKSGTPSHEWTEEAIRGMVINPIYAGVGPFPRLVKDDAWVHGCARLIEEEGAEQSWLTCFSFYGSLSTQDLCPKATNHSPKQLGMGAGTIPLSSMETDRRLLWRHHHLYADGWGGPSVVVAAIASLALDGFIERIERQRRRAANGNSQAPPPSRTA
jgi:hypothetical protein